MSGFPSSGGGLPSGVSIQKGSGSPYNVTTPSNVGALYLDTTNGALYVATGAAKTNWIAVGGVLPGGPGPPEGVVEDGTGSLYIWGDDPSNSSAHIQLQRVGAVGDGTGNVQVKAGGSAWTLNGSGSATQGQGIIWPGSGQAMFFRDGGAPSNAHGQDGDWAFSANGSLYYNSGGAWVQKTPGYVSGAGRVNGADADYNNPPPDGTVEVVRNSTNGNVYISARANGTWKAVQLS